MKRQDFLRILGIATLSPSVMITAGVSKEIKQDIPVHKFNPKKWPIYPDRVQFGYQEGEHIAYTAFSYVRINRNNTDYLIPIRETCMDREESMNKRFEYEANQITERFIVDESNKFMFENGFVIKYNPDIHHD